jgi:hypothetical protein
VTNLALDSTHFLLISQKNGLNEGPNLALFPRMKKPNAKPAHIIAAAAFTMISTTAVDSWALGPGSSCEGSFVEQTQTSRLRQTMQNFGLFARGNGRAGKSQDQNVPQRPAIATIEQFKTALQADTSALKSANYRVNENPAMESFFNAHLLSLYQMIGRDGRELIDLIRLSGTPISEKWVAGYRGESIFQTDAPQKIVATVLRLNNSSFNPETSTAEIAHSLNLNAQYIALRDGLLMVEERSASTSGMGIHDPGVHHAGLSQIRDGKVPGFSVAPLSYDNALSQGSVWGGRYSSTTITAVVPMDAAKFSAAKNNLGNQLVELNLQALASNRISDSNLNQWLDQVSKYTLKSMPWYQATTSGSAVESIVLKAYQANPTEFKSALVRHLYTRRILNLQPTETFQHKSSSDPRFYLDGATAENISQRGKPVDTVAHFPKDLPFVRSGLERNTLEVFGHLHASDTPSLEMNAEAVQAFIRKNVPEILRQSNQADITDIVVTGEGQFSAKVVFKAKPSMLRRLIGRE